MNAILPLLPLLLSLAGLGFAPTSAGGRPPSALPARCDPHGWTIARADPTSRQALVEQRIAVERAAAAVASARLEGARRADIKQLMATYREAAQRLAALEAAAAPSPDQTAESFRQAQVDVAAAVAEGGEAAEAREALTRWLGDLSARLKLLDEALAAARVVSDAELVRDILLDTAEQAQGVMLAAAYDAHTAATRAQRAEVRAQSLRRAVPGQGSGLDDAVEALRLEQEAAQDRERQTAARRVYDAAALIRAASLQLLE